MKFVPPFILVVCIAIAGCGSGGFSKRSAATKGSVLRYAINASPTTLDPGKVQDIDTNDLIINVYEGLVAYNAKNVIEPRIASSYSSPDGGKTWIFKIRKGVKFHNGREVTADDFAWTFDRNCSKELASPTARNYLADIAGVEDRFSGKSAHITGVSVPDPSTLKIVLDQPRLYFIGKLTYPCAFALCKEAVGSGSIDSVSQAVGAGPFKLESYLPDQQVNLVAFNDYWGGKPSVDRVEQPVIKDAATRLMKFKTGDLDILTLVRKDIPGILADKDLKPMLQYETRPAVYYIGLNQIQTPVLRDVRVRRAIAQAIDRRRICHDLLGGVMEAHGLLTPGLAEYRNNYAGLPFDPAAARAELAAAGYPGGKGFPPIELTFRDQTADSRVCCEGVIESLRQNLGINVSARTIEWSAFLQARNENKLQLFFLSWYADYLDGQNELSFLLTSSAKLNHDGYSNPKFDTLSAQADASGDEAARIKLYQQAEDVAIQDGARIPIYYQQDPVLVNPRVHGRRSNVFGQLPDTTVNIQ